VATLLLIRHAESIWNEEGRIQGQTDIPLSDRGRHQARLLAERLASSPIRAGVSSDLLRASQTAEIVASALEIPVALDQRLREASFGAWEGKTRAEIELHEPDALRRWLENQVLNRPPGGEGIGELQARALDCLSELLGPPGIVAAVSHGGTIRAALAGVLGLPLEAYRVFRQANTALNEVLFGGPTPRLMRYNDVGHLEASRWSALPSDHPVIPCRVEE
jgi:broad specificity phosphatase PhoE